MTKICPNCGNKNKDTSKFCESCGTTLSDITIKSKSNMESLKSSWNKQSTGIKALIGIGGICCVGLILLVVIAGIISPDVNTSNTTSQSSDDANSINKTTQSTNTQVGNEYTIGNSKFRLSGDWKEGWSSGEEAVGVERIRLDGNGKAIIMTQFFDKSKYISEGENAVNKEIISSIQCKKVPGVMTYFFEKNGKYYYINVCTIDSSGNFEDGTSDDVKYIEEIIGSLQ